VQNAPGRAAALGARYMQLFTKMASRWAEPAIDDETVERFRNERIAHGIEAAAAHDSYLINLASPDPALFERSLASFTAELERCARLGIEYVVTHPGNATDANRERGMLQNGEAIARALDAVEGAPTVLLEGTAGTGHSLGHSFEELARIIEAMGSPHGDRTGVCLDTCHLWASGHDIRGDWEGVVERLDRLLGLERVRLFHLNDSATPFNARRDRHAHIGEGTLGDDGFRPLLTDPRFRDVPKLLETPKDDDAVAADLMNLARLRAVRG